MHKAFKEIGSSAVEIGLLISLIAILSLPIVNEVGWTNYCRTTSVPSISGAVSVPLPARSVIIADESWLITRGSCSTITIYTSPNAYFDMLCARPKNHIASRIWRKCIG